MTVPDTNLQTAPEIFLPGRKVLVTGAARGLGESFARALVAAGAQVVISDVLHERGQALATQLGVMAHYVPMDLADGAAITAGVAAAALAMGGIDGLINNAAITNSGGKTMSQLSAITWDQVMAVNVRGTWAVSVAATAHLAKSGAGRIVNLASDTALWGAPNLMAYVASKGAVIAMTRSMARELGPQGITVNAIAPGLTLVEATQYVPQERHDHYLEGRAVKRPQVPADVTAAALFLLTRASGFITGQVLPVNGGFVMN
jgi:NAD(P)-dependent dehydrogenase (short-subunit alcohol dehydrogenase family)